MLNPADGPDKVCFPPDFETVDDAIDSIATDDTIVPLPVESGQRFDDQFIHFRHKHGSYWRWVRPVFDGPTKSDANARIEFRPLSGQPTVRDAVAFQAVFAGLMESLPRCEHPVGELDWKLARDNFYAAMRNGLQADFDWLTANGTETTDHEQLYQELFEHARDGLEMRGLSDEEVDKYVEPLRQRFERRLSPARWKHNRVKRQVSRNVPLTEAVWEMQSAYLQNQRETLIEGSFIDWLV
jgi:hypothetical protein